MTARSNKQMSASSRRLPSRWDRRTVLLYEIAAALLLMALVLGGSLITSEINRRQWIEHSYSVIRGLSAVLGDITDAETGERGLVTTGDGYYRTRYGAACARLGGDLDTVSALVADNPSQTQKATELRRLVTAKVADMNQLIEFGGVQNWSKLMAVAHTGRGLRLMDQIRGILGDMSGTEFSLLRTRTDAALHLSRWILPASGIGAIGALTMLVLGLHLNGEEKRRRALAEKAFQQSEARFRVLIEGISDYGIFMLDPTGMIISWNAGAERVKGYTADEAIGQHFSIFFPAEDIAAGKPAFALDQACLGGHHEEESWRLRKDGSRFWANATLTAMRDGDGMLLGFAKIVQDLTIRKQTEDALREAKELAEASARAKSIFLATMSHELRTPMTGVLGMIELLQNNPSASETRLFLDTLRTSAKSLMMVLGDILDLSKIEADRIELEHLDFNVLRLVSNTIDLFMPQASAKGLSLALRSTVGKDQSVVRGDPGRIRQVISNLISNALKFTPRGSIEVSVTAPPPGDVTAIWRFEIRDTGIGMTPAELSQIFDSFSQADSSTARRFGGTGLGLSISKRLIELMGGQIGAESSLGAGSLFWLNIPLSPGVLEAITDDSAPEDLTPIARPLNILIAEDNPVNQLLCTYMLQQMGHEVTSVGNGQEAVDAVTETPFDLILMDMQMPGMDGPEATRRIRRLPGAISSIPIIGLTADITVENRHHYQASGLSGFVTKPIDPRRLRAEIEAAMGEPARPLLTNEAAAGVEHAG